MGFYLLGLGLERYDQVTLLWVDCMVYARMVE